MSRKKPSGGELQTAANRQAILPAQTNPKEKINEWLYQEYYFQVQECNGF